MTGFHDDLLKQIAKMIALESHETKPVIHININLDKCWQLFEGDGGGNGDKQRRSSTKQAPPCRYQLDLGIKGGA